MPSLADRVRPNEVLLHDAGQRAWLHFRRPHEVISCRRLPEILPALQHVEEQVRQAGRHAAGFIAYEAAPAFDAALPVGAAGQVPLIWFGIYPAPAVVDLAPAGGASAGPAHWQPSVTESDYRQAIAAIKEEIAAGNSYQVNYSLRLDAPFSDDPWPYFLQLVQAQGAGYAAYLNMGRFAICSASPELFFTIEGEQLCARPMKGTAPRGLTWEADAAQGRWLQQSEKNRAENVMIVDMIRNDMGRIAESGSVAVPSLFNTERYPTLWQMTSTVTARSRASWVETLQAMFPCASITGAPKRSTMEIISRLETRPRQIYTGSIGYLAPGRSSAGWRAQFNVAIRTVLVDRLTQQAEYGTGGGVVWDSTEEGEWEECATKAAVLTAQRPRFQLLETMLWTRAAGYYLLERHVQRLGHSADYFSFAYDETTLQGRLEAESRDMPGDRCRVRLLLSHDGSVTLESVALDENGGEWRAPLAVCLARRPLQRANPFLYHKTTHRVVYEEARADQAECDDVLLWNEEGELTEFCLGNLVVELDGERLTPPVSCGLLPGTYRAELLETGQVREAVIRVEDLARCSPVWLVNSVRGEQPVRFAARD